MEVVDEVPDSFFLEQNYPNPFNGATTIHFGLNRSGHVRLTLYNLLGQQIRALLDGDRPAGVHQVAWDGRSDQESEVASGVYFYRLSTPDQGLTRRLIVLR